MKEVGIEFSADNRAAPGYRDHIDRLARDGDPLYEDEFVRAPQGEFSIGGELWPGLSKLIEECGEVGDILPELILLKSLGHVQQVAGKIIGAEGRPNHWDGSHLPTRLTEELGDLLACIWFVADRNGNLMEGVTERAVTKIKLFDQWHDERLAGRNQR